MLLIAISLADVNGLSSRIAQNNEVLINGSGCAKLDLSNNASDYVLLGSAYNFHRATKAADYALRC